jgi:arabinan endo-1,5-alpha-L-arabinosidase
MNCGSFTDHGSSGVSSSTGSAYNAIDGQLFADGGSNYMNFGSFWNDIYQVKMASPPTGTAGSSVQLSFDPTGTHPEEGSYMVKYGGYYYLFFSV